MDGAADTGTAAQTPAPRDVEIAGLTADSRRVQPGYLFAALPGTQVDGRTFIPQAIEHGAAAILGAPDAAPAVTDPGVAFVADPNPRRRLALMAARFFGRQPATVAAVTGTNGKTSVATFARQLWTALGEKAASMGTIGISAPGYERKGSLTTPDPVALHEDLSMLAGLGVDRLALEASSHGLEQYRLDGVVFAAAAFTNLTRDHLDYHGTMEGYLKAKLRLFGEMLAPGAAAVLNRDSDACPAFAEAATGHGLRVVDYGHKAKDIRLDRATPRPDGLDLAFTAFGRNYEVHLPLVGGFQAMNALAAFGLVTATGGDAGRAAAALATLKGAPGRVERAGKHHTGAAIYIDYAHTPDALETVLAAVRPHAEHRLVVVFGCGGDRDPGKRPMMGAAAARLADRVIVTDDNPRSEDAASIRRAVLAGCPEATEIGDRAEAIAAAIGGLEAGDVLVIAGKGHEQGQIVGDRVLPFDDREVAQRVLRETGGFPDE